MQSENLIQTFRCEGTPATDWKVMTTSLHETLNEPFVLRIHLGTEDLDTEPGQMLGQPAKLTLTRDTVMRQVTGIVSAVEEGSTHPQVVTTTVTVVPALEALRHRINTKIFQEMTVSDILDDVLGEGLGAWSRTVDNRLSRTYPSCEYRVQYNESDFSFCQRLMEEEGIVYWFEFEGEAETMVLADEASKFGKIASLHGDVVEFSLQDGQVGGQEFVSDFHGVSQLTPTKVATRHFDWTHPSVPIEGENSDAAEIDRPNGALLEPEREVYEQDEQPLTLSEYDGAAFGANDVDDQTKLRREAQAWESFVCEGESTVLGMITGSTFDLVGHPTPGLGGCYLVLSVTHISNEDGRGYRNEIECLPETVPFRPKCLLQKPRVASIQTATVVGPSGEEIHTDEHGRIKVQFHWDRLGASDDNSSCWIRVMQPWAGAGWGHVFIPRIGMEVSVGFVDGDPDRPLVIGSMYNEGHHPPYPLPDEKTKSTIKSETSLGGGGYNEFRFEDKAGEEEIFNHAQKDQNEVIENDHTQSIGNDDTITVGNNQTQEIGNDQTEHVMANQSLEVDANRTIQVHGNFDETIDGSETRTVSSGVTETIDAGETRTITGGMTEDITGDRSQSITGSSSETITGSLSQTIFGGASITTPASYDITAVGGYKMTTPASTTIIAPGGFKFIAPGGKKTVDFNWCKVGSKHWYNFLGETDTTQNSTSIIGANTCKIGVHLEQATLKIVTGSVLKADVTTNIVLQVNKMRQKGVEVKVDGTKIEI